MNKPPSDWLADSVATAFPESVSLLASVPVESGVAQVDLSDSALTVNAETMNRMLTQLEASLATDRVTDVQLSVGTTPVTATSVPVKSTRVTGPSLVVTKDGLGFIVGDQLEPVPGLSDALTRLAPVSVQVNADRDLDAVRVADGSVWRQGSDGSSDQLDTRGGLVDPTIDPLGMVWSVPGSAPASAHGVPDERYARGRRGRVARRHADLRDRRFRATARGSPRP